MLVDLIIPKDERSGSATDAGVPEFMDFICAREPELPDVGPRRPALARRDSPTTRTTGTSRTAPTRERRAMLDQIAWPAKAKPEMRAGVEFFNRIRDFTASGFFSSQMGVKDIGYIGNTALAEWKGCPPTGARNTLA